MVNVNLCRRSSRANFLKKGDSTRLPFKNSDHYIIVLVRCLLYKGESGVCHFSTTNELKLNEYKSIGNIKKIKISSNQCQPNKNIEQ